MTQLYNIMIFFGAGASQNFFGHFLYPLNLQKFLGQTKRIPLNLPDEKNHSTCLPEVEQVKWHLLVDEQVRGYHRYFAANFQLVPLH